MNTYDKQLLRLEEAEERVRLAKLDLLEAEKELDDTLALVESELDEDSSDDTNSKVTIQVFKDGEWITVNKQGNPEKGDPMTFKSEDEARDSKYFKNRVNEIGDIEGIHIRIVNDADED